MTSPDPAATADADLDDVIFRAEWKRRMLERLAEVGMEMVEQVRTRATAWPDAWSGERPQARVDFAPAFAQVSRAVRLTLALHTQIEQEILALRRGERPPAPTSGLAPTAWGEAPRQPAPASEPGDPRRAARARVRGAVFAAVDQAIGDRSEAFEILDRADERLTERADYEAFLKLPFRECVAAICADLGFGPHWSLWSDWEGFVEDETAPRFDWVAQCSARPGRETAPPARSPGQAPGRPAEAVRVSALE